MADEPQLQLLYTLTNPDLGDNAQVAVTFDPADPTLNTLDIHIQNPAASPLVTFDNAHDLTPEDPLPTVDQSYSGPRLDRLYVYFPWGPSSGALATRELAASFTLSPAPDNVTWYSVPMSSPDDGPYWLLFPRTEQVLQANESVRFRLAGVQTTNPPDSTTTLVVKKEVTDFKVGTDRNTSLLLRDAPPRITSFTADRSRVPPGTAVELAWTTWNAAAVEISPDEGHQKRPANGATTVQPTRTTTYVLKALGSGPTKNTTEPLTVSVEPVEIESFTANPEATVVGYPARLAWRTRCAVAATIFPDVGPVPVNGTIRTPPRTEKTRYVLKAEGEGGPKSLSVDVEIADQLHFSVPYQQGPHGGRVMFNVIVTHASAGATVSLSLDPPPPGGERTGIENMPIPSGSHTYLVGCRVDVPPEYVGTAHYSYDPNGSLTSRDLAVRLQVADFPYSDSTQPRRSGDDAVSVSIRDVSPDVDWDDLYLRVDLEDHGIVPRSGPKNRSPDVIPDGILPVDDPQTLFSRRYGEEVAKSLTLNAPNYVYVRARNLAAEPRSGKAYLYWLPRSLLLYPSVWQENVLHTSSGKDHLAFDEVPSGAVVSSEPFVFVAQPSEGAWVLIARLVTEEHPNRLPATIPAVDPWIAGNGGLARYDAPVTSEGSPTFTTRYTYVQGAEGDEMVIALRCTNLPEGSEVWVSSGSPLADDTTVRIPPWTIPEPDREYLFGTQVAVPASWETAFWVCYRSNGAPHPPGFNLSLRVYFQPHGQKPQVVLSQDIELADHQAARGAIHDQ